MLEGTKEKTKPIPLSRLAPQLSAYLKREGVKAKLFEYESEYHTVRGRKDYVVMARIDNKDVEIGDLIIVRDEYLNNIIYEGELFGYENSLTKMEE